MIAFLQGVLRRTVSTKQFNAAVVDVQGVGYQVFVSARVISQLPGPGEKVAFEILTHVREDAIQLYGFLDAQEQEIFEALIALKQTIPGQT